MKLNFKFISKVLGAIVICESVGLLSIPFTLTAIPTWYAGLHKASLNPPAWVFGPVWTTLYFLMGIALFLVWNKKNQGRLAVTKLLGIQMFVLQLVLNFFWSVIFFGWQQPFFALWEMGVLWMTILACMLIFARISKAAGYILIPYLLWVTFAGYLNYSVWVMNR